MNITNNAAQADPTEYRLLADNLGYVVGVTFEGDPLPFVAAPRVFTYPTPIEPGEARKVPDDAVCIQDDRNPENVGTTYGAEAPR